MSAHPTRVFYFIILLAAGVFSTAPYCIPEQECFPSRSSLETFNDTVSGRLRQLAPYASVCYGDDWDMDACHRLFHNASSGSFRVQKPNALMFTNWEVDDGEGCPQPYSLRDTPLVGNCSLGALPAYEVLATSTVDVSAAVKFAAKYNLRLRIKNTGHDYLGRSSAPGSFTIWTHQLKSAAHIPSFVPAGCSRSTKPVDALLVGSGMEVLDLWTAADQYSVTTIGGFTATVGAAGGFILGGGAGPLSRLYGLGVDNVLQYTVVTADGAIKTANACTNKELFWALRGGGGAFGVAIDVVLKAWPAFHAVNAVHTTFVANSTSSYTEFMSTWLSMQTDLADAGLAGISEAAYPGGLLLYVQPFVNSSVKDINETLGLFQRLNDIPGVELNLEGASFKTWLETYTQVVEPTVAGSDAVGVNLIVGDRLLMRDTFTNSSSVGALAAYITNMTTPVIFQAVGGGMMSSLDPDSRHTSSHPGWRKALLHANFPVFDLTQPILTSQQNNTLKQILEDIDEIIYPDEDPVAYYNEDWTGETDWQTRSFGKKNYERLLAIKKQVDPFGVFTCTNCVGSEIFGA
ncbi:FAD-binding domain-containing protein [Punctularia strigosozonata HHB-11173 SS5]|uniref:FAD-binding domain-containing protein n=1 Tax=Punctularia strigosozonata (strain HHB-11173) TaxID=741275 RepID=UPI000441873C|nr:FAD-binding domain-containing protein [Punctularia strigosozonata HHB-11173 SS5]EIN13056.1 FAD-binding domain-containing protein [Punctularia strigosozonata HHB-11173 SS5]